jgi:hypothetical protein
MSLHWVPLRTLISSYGPQPGSLPTLDTLPRAAREEATTQGSQAKAGASGQQGSHRAGNWGLHGQSNPSPGRAFRWTLMRYGSTGPCLGSSVQALRDQPPQEAHSSLSVTDWVSGTCTPRSFTHLQASVHVVQSWCPGRGPAEAGDTRCFRAIHRTLALPWGL